jgi:hypothetical protein
MGVLFVGLFGGNMAYGFGGSGLCALENVLLVHLLVQRIDPI